eukprot:1174834-Pleurochrysis_carterae.AAC.2
MSPPYQCLHLGESRLLLVVHARNGEQRVREVSFGADGGRVDAKGQHPVALGRIGEEIPVPLNELAC